MEFNDIINDGSGAESAEEDDRSDEIKQLLTDAFSNETFDDESEHSFAVNASIDKQHQYQNQQQQHQPLMHGGNVTTNMNGSNGHANGLENVYNSTKSHFPSLRTSDVGALGMAFHNSNVNGNGFGMNGLNVNGHGGPSPTLGMGLGAFHNGSGNAVNRGLEDANLNFNHNAINGNGAKKVRFDSSLGERDVQLLTGRQSDRGDDEMEVINPTISLLHQNHCPQKQIVNGNILGNGNGIVNRNSSGDSLGHGRSGGASEVWDKTEYESKMEQLTNLLQHRERQIERLEEDSKTYAKDKRSLNHEIGLIKTEMVQMKNSQDELHKVIQLRDEEIRYLKTKMTEAIEEYEQVRSQELSSKEEMHRYMDEVEKLQQQVQLLSSIGSQAHQAEISDVVRQVREKHSRELAQWQSLTADLESQLQVYKRSQQNTHNESVIVEIEHTGTQTDAVEEKEVPVAAPVSVPEPVVKVDFGQSVNLQPQVVMEVKETQTIQMEEEKKRESFSRRGSSAGGDGDTSSKMEIVKDSTVLDKYKEALAKSEEDKHRLIDFYEKELEDYKTKLAVLPSELYNVWTTQQEELGLLYANISTNTSYVSPAKSVAQVQNLSPLRVPKAVTETVSTTEIATQTDKSQPEPLPQPTKLPVRLITSASQTEKEVPIRRIISSAYTQTEKEFQEVPKIFSSTQTQTEKEVKEKPILKRMFSSHTQTDVKPTKASGIQTDMPMNTNASRIPVTPVSIYGGSIVNAWYGPCSGSCPESSSSESDRDRVTEGNLHSSNSHSACFTSTSGGTPGSMRDKETSSVVIQTEETLETFNVLGELIQDWAKEVAYNSQRAQLAEKELVVLSSKYRELLKTTKACKQNWKEQELYLREKCEEQKKKFITVLSKVSSTLDIIE